MGEAKKRGLVVRQQVVEALGLQTASGQIKVRWDENGQATAQGQMAFFIEFLSTTGLFDQWVVAEDTLRRALKAIEERTGTEWLSRHIGRTVLGLLDCPWSLDVDVTIKPLYGKQQGAVVGYNPHKPGRPSHAYHSYQVSGLRLMLGVDVLAGNHSHANHTLPGLLQILDGLASHKRPKLVRGDAG